MELFQDSGKIGSRMVVVAVQAGKRPVDVLHMTYAQKELIGSGGYFPEDVRDVMRIMASGRYNIASIITHEFPHRQMFPKYRFSSVSRMCAASLSATHNTRTSSQ